MEKTIVIKKPLQKAIYVDGKLSHFQDGYFIKYADGTAIWQSKD